MWHQILTQLVASFVPMVRDIIAEHHARTGSIPTEAEITATFHANLAKSLAVDDEWLRTHPKT